MSNEYEILQTDGAGNGSTVYVYEQSLLLNFCVEVPNGTLTAGRMTPDQFRTAIIKQIEVLSYFSDDADEVLKRFNVEYGQVK